MKKLCLVCSLFFCCGLLYARNDLNIGISYGDVTQSFLDDGVSKDLSFSGVGIYYATVKGDSFVFFSSGMFYFFPLALHYGNTALSPEESIMCVSMDVITGPGYSIALMDGFDLTIGAGLHLAIIGFVPSSSSPYSDGFFDTMSIGIGIAPSFSFKLYGKTSMIIGISAAYDFVGFGFEGVTTRLFNNGYAYGGFMGVSFAL